MRQGWLPVCCRLELAQVLHLQPPLTYTYFSLPLLYLAEL